MKEPAWLTHARSLLGLHEIPGTQHEARILEFAADAGLSWVKDDETPWCAIFVGGCLKRAGIKPSGSAAARSYLSWGFDCNDLGNKQIPLGAIVVYSRAGSTAQGHVGFAVGLTPEGNILTLGGNQSDQVSIRPFAPTRLIGVRWPNEERDSLWLLPRNLPVLTTAEAVSVNEA